MYNEVVGQMAKFSTRAIDVVKEEGVRDLPTGIKSKFAMALVNERKGNFEKANQLLDEAIALEAELRATAVAQ